MDKHLMPDLARHWRLELNKTEACFEAKKTRRTTPWRAKSLSYLQSTGRGQRRSPFLFLPTSISGAQSIPVVGILTQIMVEVLSQPLAPLSWKPWMPSWLASVTLSKALVQLARPLPLLSRGCLSTRGLVNLWSGHGSAQGVCFIRYTVYFLPQNLL